MAANIFCLMPDHPSLLQSHGRQKFDLHPDLPELKKFLTFRSRSLAGALHSVTVARQGSVKPAELRAVGGEFLLH